MPVIINSDPNALVETATVIKDAYLKIGSDTEILNSELKNLEGHLDSSAYTIICTRVKALLAKIEETEEPAVGIYKALLEYAEAIRKGTNILG